MPKASPISPSTNATSCCSPATMWKATSPWHCNWQQRLSGSEQLMDWLETPDDISGLTEGMTPLDAANSGDLLVVLPHPDDECFAAGGTLALFSDQCRQVHYLIGIYGDGSYCSVALMGSQ